MPEAQVKRGRKKKESPVVKEKKKRGRKPAFEYYATSACKRNTTKKTDVTSNAIIQLDISDTEETDTLIKPIDEISESFKEIDIVEKFYDELQKDNNTSLEELYDIELKQRHTQDVEFFETLDKNWDELEKIKSSTNIKDTNVDKNEVLVLSEFIENEWPQRTNVMCWWCCNGFDSVPVGVPIKFNQKTGKFVVKGVFCSMNCMYAYTLDSNIMQGQSGKKYRFNSKHKDIRNLDSLIKDLNCKLTGAQLKDVLVPALPRETLIDFGGELSIEAFRDHTKNGRIFNRINYPLTVVKDIIEIKDIENLKKRQEQKNEGTEKIVIKDLVKPIQRKTIDSILNIEYD